MYARDLNESRSHVVRAEESLPTAEYHLAMIAGPLDEELAGRLLDTLAPLAACGLSVQALAMKWDASIVQALGHLLRPADFESVSRGTRRPASASDWSVLLRVGEEVIKLLAVTAAADRDSAR